MTNLIDKALELAAAVHEGQVDKSGKPFILHILNVALQGTNDLEIVVGLLHDTVEDSDGLVTIEDLERHFPADVTEAVDALTRREGEKYREYLERCTLNPLAARVKLYDLIHNLNPNRADFAGAFALRKRHQFAFDFVYNKLRKEIAFDAAE